MKLIVMDLVLRKFEEARLAEMDELGKAYAEDADRTSPVFPQPPLPPNPHPKPPYWNFW